MNATTIRSLGALVAVAALAGGCDSGGPIDDFITAPLFVPPKGSLADQQLVVPRGRALAFVAQPVGSRETLKVRVTLTSENESVAHVDKTVEMNQFVLTGVTAGKTELTVRDEDGQTASPRFSVEVVEP